jgi:universal stress protein E
MSKHAISIVGIDPHAPDRDAAALGAYLAERLGTALELYSAVYNSQVTLANFETRASMQHARDLLVAHARELLDGLAQELPGGRIACNAAWDHPFEEALIRRVLECEARLLVVGLPEEEEARGRRFWSAGHWQLVRHCPAPVLLTHGRAWSRPPVVLAAVDPVGHHARHADLERHLLAQAAELASATGGELHVWHAWEPGLGTAVGGLERTLASELPGERTAERHRDAVAEVLHETGVEPAHTLIVKGRPERVLPEYCAEHRVDVVVMGAISRNPFGRVFIGSTAERVLDRLPCDLMVVKPESFRTPVSRERWPHEEGGPPLGVPGI